MQYIKGTGIAHLKHERDGGSVCGRVGVNTKTATILAKRPTPRDLSIFKLRLCKYCDTKRPAR